MKANNRLVSDIHKMVIIVFIILFMTIPGGCKNAPTQLDPNSAEPKIFVTPETIRLGIAKMTETDIIFRGTGFTPGDSVIIKILNVQKDGKRINIPIAEANVDPNGQFETEMDILVKVAELLRAEIGMDDNFETIIIVKNKPIEAGLYAIKAECMETDKTAECKLQIKSNRYRRFNWYGIGRIRDLCNLAEDNRNRAGA